MNDLGQITRLIEFISNLHTSKEYDVTIRSEGLFVSKDNGLEYELTPEFLFGLIFQEPSENDME